MPTAVLESCQASSGNLIFGDNEIFGNQLCVCAAAANGLKGTHHHGFFIFISFITGFC